MIGELRSLQRGRLRHDGYASDSAVLDDDDETWIPHSVSGQVRHSNLTGISSRKYPQFSQLIVFQKALTLYRVLYNYRERMINENTDF